ncbi:AMP-dependent synthetase/ligase [Zafaria sp. Z1313]
MQSTQERPMREATTPLLHELPAGYGASQLLIDRLARGGGADAYAVKVDGAWHGIPTAEFVAVVRAAGRSLVEAGVRPGDAVAIMSRTRYEWAVAEQAVWFAGGVSVPVYETSSPFQVEWILRDSGARHAFAEDPQRAAVIAAAAESLGEAVTLWCFTGSAPGTDEASAPAASGVATPPPVTGGTAHQPGPGTAPTGIGTGSDLARLIGAGRTSPVSEAELEAARTSRGYDDVATLVYTSGTTGRPKGCMMTHGNFAAIAVNLVPHMREVVSEGSRTLMFLPLAHVLARAVQQCCLHAGTTVAHTPGAADLMEDLKTFRPTFLLAVPRIFEKIRSGALAKAEAGGKAGLFLQAEEAAVDVSRWRDAKARGGAARLPLATRARHLFFDKALYPKLRAVLGGQAEYAISGASELNTGLAHFFRGAGIGLLEGYGLTETTAPATVNMAGDTRVGSVGRPIPGTTVRIADDGEVLIKGIGVFAGYHDNPEASAEAFDADGFFRTGDLGTLDDGGFLTITGRKKDLLVTAGGKNVAPGPLEEIVRACRIVGQVVLVGENRPFIGALVTLDRDELGPWAAGKGLGALDPSEAVRHPEVLAEIQAAVDEANATVSRAEGIRRFVVLDEEFTEESGHLTPSLKLKRLAVMESSAGAIEKLYAG